MKKTIIILLFILASSFSLSCYAKNILIIQSYHIQYKWDQSYIQGIREGLEGQNHKITLFEMNTKRIPKEKFQKKSDEAWNLYLKTKPDIVILGDDNAVSFLIKRFSTTNTPVVFLGLGKNPRDYSINKYRNVTGVLERPLFRRNIIEISQVINIEKSSFLLLFDNGISSKIAANEAFKGKMKTNWLGHKIRVKNIITFSNWKQNVLLAKKNGHHAIIVGGYHTLISEDGKKVSAKKVIEWTSKNTKLPVFAFWDFSIGTNKAIGGLVIDGNDQGLAAAKIVKKIFSGKKPYEIFPFTPNIGRYSFNDAQLKRWKLSLPKKIKEVTRWKK